MYLCNSMSKLSDYINKAIIKAKSLWQYVSADVWREDKSSLVVNVVKTLNLSVKSFLNGDVQTQACAMTYRTLLALVPALAMLFALGRGFGLQTYLEDQLMNTFQAMRGALSQAFNFVDSYLNQASEGVFVGVGLIFLVWTLISLVSSIEEAFNRIWGVKTGRSFWRKITDYTAMLLILPIIMVCIGGINVMMSSTLQTIFHFPFLTPLVSILLEVASYVFTWLFFTAVYMLIPNAEVKFRNAFIAGIISGTGFIVLQWIFVTGQMYVARNNAIYGSFSFLPLLFIWLQLVWVITLSGAVICYSAQNIFRYSYNDDISHISPRYREKVIMAVATVTVQRFCSNCSPVTSRQLIVSYGLPPDLVTRSLDVLLDAGLISRVVTDIKKEQYAYQPALPPDDMTIALVRKRLDMAGSKNFIRDFNTNYSGIVKIFDGITQAIDDYAGNIKLNDIDIIKLCDDIDLCDSGNQKTNNQPNKI